MPLIFSYGSLQQEAVQLSNYGRVLRADTELAATDAYERDAEYVRVVVELASGRNAWVYVSQARTAGAH